MTKQLIKEALKEYFKEQETPKLLTVSEVAKHHRVTSRTVRNWIHQGKIKYTSPSIGNYRISEEHLNNIK